MITADRKQDLKLIRQYDHSKDDTIKANKILADFFTDFTLEHAKDDLWSLIKAAMGDRTGSQEEVSHLLFVYEWLNDVLVASYLVTKKKYLKRKPARRK